MILPDDVINEIMNYGDVNVTLKYIGVINQLNYYKKEFDYQSPFIMQAYRDDEGVSIFKSQLDWIKRYIL